MQNEQHALWLIDGSYLNQSALNQEAFQLDYLKLRNYVASSICPNLTTYYLHSSTSNPSQQKQAFFNWMQSAPPKGPGMIVKSYPLKECEMSTAYCDVCQRTVQLSCPNSQQNGQYHRLSRELQKGVDVGLATLATTRVHQYDILILSSGDGDLLDAIDYVIAVANKKLHIVGFHNGMSTDLQCRASKIHWIDTILNQVRRNDYNAPAKRMPT